MKKNKAIFPSKGLLSSSMNVRNKEFKALQLFLAEKSNSLSEKQKTEIELYSLKVMIEDYLNSNDDKNEDLSVGYFLRLYIDTLDLKQNKLAKYIGLNAANFSNIISGNRKINFELSYVLSQIFELEPQTWILIQVKNEYKRLKRIKGKDLEKYKLEDLIEA